jgi:hypothetical protein
MKLPKIAKDPQKNWENDEIQFPRLIEEAQAAGAFTAEVIDDMAKAMDLPHEDIEELLERAADKWEAIKDQADPEVLSRRQEEGDEE